MANTDPIHILTGALFPPGIPINMVHTALELFVPANHSTLKGRRQMHPYIKTSYDLMTYCLAVPKHIVLDYLFTFLQDFLHCVYAAAMPLEGSGCNNTVLTANGRFAIVNISVR